MKEGKHLLSKKISASEITSRDEDDVLHQKRRSLRTSLRASLIYEVICTTASQIHQDPLRDHRQKRQCSPWM